MTVLRDVEGFRDAMGRMRTAMGTNVVFYKPYGKTYPPGTAMDPETGEPFDPTITPASGGGFAEVQIHVGVYAKPVPGTMEDDSIQTPVGWYEDGNAVLDVDPTDWDDNELEDFTEVQLYGERYEITDADPRGLGDTPHRILVFVRRK